MSAETLVITGKERKILAKVIAEQFEFFYETLRDEHETKAAAMAAFDADKMVQVYTKLDPEGAAELRKGTEEELEGWLDDEDAEDEN